MIGCGLFRYTLVYWWCIQSCYTVRHSTLACFIAAPVWWKIIPSIRRGIHFEVESTNTTRCFHSSLEWSAVPHCHCAATPPLEIPLNPHCCSSSLSLPFIDVKPARSLKLRCHQDSFSWVILDYGIMAINGRLVTGKWSVTVIRHMYMCQSKEVVQIRNNI